MAKFLGDKDHDGGGGGGGADGVEGVMQRALDKLKWTRSEKKQ